ncbi:transcriptional regulator of RNA polII, SAGA, subunit-domain-containing protein [Sphaerosporella brunnea]|uniref:Transcriptional regulator of RNA polII, SAGA, subunit-domain-containing protein n=1 Tax=Sphaerosporella brunnea TaxID=1250544 RepID=A0A5J5EUS1_9PEZI|nr:transcriptional regulator of RNA polII, SAGA, subunit-domain-containing protein [Sphaerosporella brunnea]
MDPSQLTKNPPPNAQIIQSSNVSAKTANGMPPGMATATAHKMAPPSVAPRLDVQPYHEALKSALTKEHWMTYTEALNKFLRGRLSHAELFEEIGPFIKGPTIRLHNSLLTAMIANMSRDSPQVEVATWVSASDKPNSVSKLPAGDVNERRLKKEVMAISARERRRIKEVPDKVGSEIDPLEFTGKKKKLYLTPAFFFLRFCFFQVDNIEDTLENLLQRYHMAKQVRPPEPPQRSATINKTNWESEIKQRYTLPLASETGEFPDIDNIRLRMLPICFEEGILGGCTMDAASFMNIATETFVKEILTTIISRVRSNGPNYVQTDKYRKLAPKGRYAAAGERPLLGMHDVRLSLTLGDNFLTQMPLSMKKIMAGGWYERDYEVDPNLQFEDDPDAGGWEGGAPEDRKDLKSLLDDCLAMTGV